MPKHIYKKTKKGLEEVGILPSSTEWDGKVNKAGDTMSGNLTPATNKGASLGTSSLYWSNIYATKFNMAGKAAVQYNSTEDCIEFIFA